MTTTDTNEPPLLAVRDLAVSFDVGRRRRIVAVDRVDLTVEKGRTLAVVGESGCGKSVTALTILGLIACPPGRVDRGSIRFAGREVLDGVPADGSARRALRGRDIAMIFQEPMSSLNPVLNVGTQIVEAMRRHQGVSKREAWERAAAALTAVGVPRPETSLRSYPHEFSGGMCQRAMIAMALACQPRLLIADEPTTALDVTIQAQILDLLGRVRDDTGMGLLLITHDLGVVARLADMVCVMYAGRVVEYASRADLFARPSHPYTRGLFSSIPRLRQRRRRLRTVAELVDDPGEFRRLPSHELGIVPWWPDARAPDDTAGGEPSLVEVERRHWVACWRTAYVREHPGTVPA